ncbi:MAG: bifunctional hydroxymethylpyrimidine kinase/phosphomethylpyrimidine kinase [Candidatus Omnitrophica bacterium]|nr:bifunctional hydroxymethylpyrimidine kinase/phosphomethylpyrimidine kinase [Candidatus Omnitrophota bacterium]
MSILVVGSVALDKIKTPYGESNETLGGSATYFSASAVNFSPVNLVAVVGEDFPKNHIQLLKDRNIGLEGLTVQKGKTFRWEGEYGLDFCDAKTIATHLNVFAQFNPVVPDKYRNNKYVFLANIDPEIQLKVLKQMNKPKLVACDTMNYWIESKRNHLMKVLKNVDIVFVNGSEAKQLTSEINLIKAGKEILKFGPKVVVVKKGEHGVILFSKNDIFVSPAFLLESISDPTGAGDTFAGGFMGYLAKNKLLNKTNLRNAVIHGCVMATFAVEDFSPKRLTSIKTADITQRLNKFKKFTEF